MILLDSCTVLALYFDEPAAGQVADVLGGAERSELTSLGLAEIIDVCVRQAGFDEEEVALDLSSVGLTEVQSVNGRVAHLAGVLRARWYHRRDCQVSLADCVAAAMAQERGWTLATADPHLLAVCQGEGIAWMALPDSSGRTWTPTA